MAKRPSKAADASPAKPFAAKDDAELLTVLTVRETQITVFRVTDHETYRLAGDDLVELARIDKRIDEHYDEDVATAFKLHRSLTTKRGAAKARVAALRAYLTEQRVAYDDAQEELRRAEERRLAEAQIAETHELALEDAAILEAQGRPDEAAAVIEQALAGVTMTPTFVPSDLPTTDGVSKVSTWDFEILNPRLIPADYWCIDEKKIGSVVRATKGTIKIPGVRVIERKGERVRV